MNIKQPHHFPLIERILIIGLQLNELEEYFKDSSSKLENINNLQLRILEEFKSTSLTPEDEDITLYETIPKFCLPEGPLHNSFHDNSPSQITSFTFLSKDKKKHITTLNYYENYYAKTNKQFSIQKIIALVSSKDVYEVHRRVLKNIYSIMTNYYMNKTNNTDKIRTVYLSETNKLYQEYKLIDFYFSFLLNSLTIKAKNNNAIDKDVESFCLYNIPNNKNLKYFLTYCTHDSSHFPLKDSNMSILLEQFHVEDLIYLYQSMLMEYKIIIVFENYEEINTILYSLTNLIFPLKWNFLIISYLVNETEMMVDAPFAIMIGAHKSYLPFINKCVKRGQFSPETIIYNLLSKEFIFLNNNFPEFPAKMNQELRGGLYYVLSEAQFIKSDASFDSKSEMAKILRNESLCSKINPAIYLNLRLTSIFYLAFLELIKTFKAFIKSNTISTAKDNLSSLQLSNYFAFNDYINNFKNNYSISSVKYMSFIQNFSKSLMFHNFILKFVKHSSTKSKYKVVNEHLDIISNANEKYRRQLKIKINEIIHNKILTYYNVSYTIITTYFKFRYIDLSDAFHAYIKKMGPSNVASAYNAKKHILWTPLEHYKIAACNIFYEAFPNKPKENDELFSVYNSLVLTNNSVAIEGIGPIVSNFDWSAVNNLKHKKTSSLINKVIKLSAGGSNTIEEEITELASSSSAKMNLIGNKKKVVSLKKVKGKKIGKYDLPLQIKHLPKPMKKEAIQNNNSMPDTNSSKKSIRHSPNPSTKSNGNVPKHQGDDECDIFSDNE